MWKSKTVRGRFGILVYNVLFVRIARNGGNKRVSSTARYLLASSDKSLSLAAGSIDIFPGALIEPRFRSGSDRSSGDVGHPTGRHKLRSLPAEDKWLPILYSGIFHLSQQWRNGAIGASRFAALNNRTSDRGAKYPASVNPPFPVARARLTELREGRARSFVTNLTGRSLVSGNLRCHSILYRFPCSRHDDDDNDSSSFRGGTARGEGKNKRDSSYARTVVRDNEDNSGGIRAAR